LQLVIYGAAIQCLHVGVADEEINPFNTVFKHVIYRIASATTYTNYFD
jgi:hypothetical protein